MSVSDRNPFASDWLQGPAEDSLRPPGTVSYLAGPTAEPLAYLTIPGLLDQACERWGARDAAIWCETGERLTWHDLRRRSDEVAAALLALGLRRGNRVGLWAPNRLESLLVQFGTARIGAILVSIDPAWCTSELEVTLNRVRCRALIMASRLTSGDSIGLLQSIAPELALRPDPASSAVALHAERVPHLKHVIVLGDGPVPARTLVFDAWRRSAGPAQQARLASVTAALEPDDPIRIAFTRGTTGAPQGATFSHFSLVNNARSAAQAMRLSSSDRVAIPLQRHHCLGMVSGVLACTAVGAAMVFPGESFDAGQTLAVVARERCTALHGVPAMFIAMLEHPAVGRHDLSTLRTGIMAGAPCPIETVRQIIDRLHMRQVTIGYGLTESSLIALQSGVDDPVDRRVSTVGRIQPHVEVKIVGPDGRIVALGTPGELCMRGYLVMRGYWEEPERTREAIDEAGWMRTGDLATIDADGWCRIVGRVRDRLIHGTGSESPLAVEGGSPVSVLGRARQVPQHAR